MTKLDNITIEPITFGDKPGENSIRIDSRRSIFQRFKVGSFTISSGGDKDIDIGFPPKMLIIKSESGTVYSDCSTSFEGTPGSYTEAGVKVDVDNQTTANVTTIVNASGTTATVTRLLNKGVRLNVSFSNSLDCTFIAIG